MKYFFRRRRLRSRSGQQFSTHEAIYQFLDPNCYTIPVVFMRQEEWADYKSRLVGNHTFLICDEPTGIWRERLSRIQVPRPCRENSKTQTISHWRYFDWSRWLLQHDIINKQMFDYLQPLSHLMLCVRTVSSVTLARSGMITLRYTAGWLGRGRHLRKLNNFIHVRFLNLSLIVIEDQKGTKFQLGEKAHVA